jgi:hypothetical protein
MYPQRYIPNILTRKDRKKQLLMLNKSKKMYKQKKYYTRKKVASYPHKTSKHILKARRIYKIDSIVPSPELARKTGCSIGALQEIVRKGEGAYYSSGSRPNQNAQSWGLARLASSVTGGNSSVVDFSILEKGCHHKKTAYKLAKKSKKT